MIEDQGRYSPAWLNVDLADSAGPDAGMCTVEVCQDIGLEIHPGNAALRIPSTTECRRESEFLTTVALDLIRSRASNSPHHEELSLIIPTKE